jgi:acetyl esterase/lipase
MPSMLKISLPLCAALLSATLAVALPSQAPQTSANQSSASTLESGAVTVKENVSYSPTDPALVLDIYQPADSGSDRRPAVILIHGGGWTSFDKSTMRGMGNFLALWLRRLRY